MAGSVMLFTVVSLLVAAPAVYAVSHTVGGSSGWDEGINYPNWASGQTFTVGDTLVFNYQLNHAVTQVSETDYGSCSSSNPIKSHIGGKTTITLTTAGAWYFICPISGHCANGQALSITVAASTSTTTTPSPPPPAGAAGGLVVGLGSLFCAVLVVLISV